MCGHFRVAQLAFKLIMCVPLRGVGMPNRLSCRLFEFSQNYVHSLMMMMMMMMMMVVVVVVMMMTLI